MANRNSQCCIHVKYYWACSSTRLWGCFAGSCPLPPDLDFSRHWSSIGKSRILFNDHLTPSKNVLMKTARVLKAEKISIPADKNCNIFMRKSNGSLVIRVSSAADIKKIAFNGLFSGTIMISPTLFLFFSFPICITQKFKLCFY